MRLAEYISAQSISPDALALRLGGVSGSGVRKWISGERQPDADMIDRIITFTEGAVTADDMHETRLAWLRANRPEKFEIGAERVAAE